MKKSPFTGGDAVLQQEVRTIEFRKEAFRIQFQYYVCRDTGKTFTDKELEQANTNQVYNKYREKYGIPFPDEIKAIRDQYGLAASKMADILGLGINVYRNYESGEVPSVSNGRLIQMVKDPHEFYKLVDVSKNEFTPEELEKINRKVLQAMNAWNDHQDLYEEIMLGQKRPGITNGYKVPNLTIISQMVLYFSEQCTPFKTKLNKLLFYADFLHFRKTGFSISGLTYQAIQRGPVPRNYDWVLDMAMQRKLVHIQFHDYGEYVGEQYLKSDSAVFDPSVFSETELGTLKSIAQVFRTSSVKEMVDKSHEEEAWKSNFESMNEISYEYAFLLKHPG